MTNNKDTLFASLPSIKEIDRGPNNMMQASADEFLNENAKIFATLKEYIKNNNYDHNESDEDIMNVSLFGISGSTLELKILSNSIKDYLFKNQEDNNKLTDGLFEIDKSYQSYYSLDDDDWGFANDHQKIMARDKNAALGTVSVADDNTTESKFKPTLDMTIETDDAFIMGFIKNAINQYMDESGISKSDMERFVVDNMIFENDFINVSGPSFQMKVLSEALNIYIHKNRIENNTINSLISSIKSNYKNEYSLTSDKYSMKHLEIINNGYKTYNVPVNWEDGIYLEVPKEKISELTKGKLDLHQNEFLIETKIQADIEVIAINPQEAITSALDEANENTYEYLEDPEITNSESSIKINDGEGFNRSPEINKYPELIDYLENKAIEKRLENISNGDIGDAGYDTNNEDDFEQIYPSTFFNNVDENELKSGLGSRVNEDGSYSLGYTGNIIRDDEEKWILATENYDELISIKEKIEFFKIERDTKNGSIEENSIEWNAKDYSLYKRYVESTGLDPLGIQPEEVENFHFPTSTKTPHKAKKTNTQIKRNKNDQ